MGVGESAFKIINLKRGNAQVKQNSLNLGTTEASEHRWQLVVDGLDECDPIGKLGQPLARKSQRLRIAIKSDQLSLGAGSQQGVGMSAQAERAINKVRRAASVGIARAAPKTTAALPFRINRRWFQGRSQQRNDFRQHDG